MDMNKMMEMFDMSKVAEWCNVENLKEMSEKNLEQCKKANAALVEGMNKYAKRQAELTKECVESNIASVKEVASAKTVEDFVAKQNTAVESWVAKNTAVVKELAEIAKESNEKAAEIVKEMMKK